MGCDIHAWVDFDSGEGDYVWTVASVHLHRNYVLFDVLAGVRNPAALKVIAGAVDLDKDTATPMVKALTDSGFQIGKPKGLPERLGFDVSNELLEYGYSSKPHMIGREFSRDGDSGTYSWPPEEIVDHHSFSWLTADELQQKLDWYALIPSAEFTIPWRAFARMFRERGEIPSNERHVVNGLRIPEMDGVLGMMRALDATGEGQSRFVFWFDN